MARKREMTQATSGSIPAPPARRLYGVLSEKKESRRFGSLSEPRARWLLTVCALLPAAVLLFYYNRNSIYVPIGYILLVSVICAVVSALFWLLALVVLRNPLAVSILCLMLWCAVFLESLLHEAIDKIFRGSAVFYLLWILPAVALAFVLRKLQVTSPFSFLLCTFITVFFLISTVHVAVLSVAKLNAPEADVKTEFTVDTNIGIRPNVYWIHCDGMLNFDSVEKYFGDNQDAFRAALAERDFLINSSARLDACQNTTVAVPALMSPHFYDSYLRDFLYEDIQTSRDRALEVGPQAMLKKVRIQNETINAFSAAGYATYTVGLMDRYFFPTVDGFYFPWEAAGIDHFRYLTRIAQPVTLARLDRFSEADAMKSVDIAETYGFMLQFFRPGTLLFGTSEPNPDSPFVSLRSSARRAQNELSEEQLAEIFMHSEASVYHGYFVNAIADIQSGAPADQPRFTVLMGLMFHEPYFLDENGDRSVPEDSRDAKYYYGQHLFYSKVLINIIDMILIKDPDAVIILQGDHGINCHSDEEMDLSFGEGKYIGTELKDSVMSAVRIPPEYRTGEETYMVQDPLNISRYIINQYVGENYEHLDEYLK